MNDTWDWKGEKMIHEIRIQNFKSIQDVTVEQTRNSPRWPKRDRQIQLCRGGLVLT